MSYREVAVSLAEQAGTIMRDNFQLGTAKTWKGDGTPLTATDTAINELVNQTIAEAFPDHAVIGEEASIGDPTDCEYVWICDPVDGTIPFSHGVPTFAFSLALTTDGETILAVVLDPMSNRLLIAEKGKGATMNGEPIRVNDRPTLDMSVVALEVTTRAAGNGTTRRELQRDGAIVNSIMSYVYGAMLVALGENTAAIYGVNHPWDTAAVDLLVREAGGRTSNLHGGVDRQDGDVLGFIASNGAVHDAVLAAVSAELAPGTLFGPVGGERTF